MLELEIKKQCKVCGSENVKDDVMMENSVECPIIKCNDCSWWG